LGLSSRLDSIEKKKCLSLARMQTRNHPTHNLIKVLTTQFWFNTASYQNHYYLPTALSKVLEKQGVAHLFKKLSNFCGTYPCFVMIKK
jgi:hypothetical protein